MCVSKNQGMSLFRIEHLCIFIDKFSSKWKLVYLTNFPFETNPFSWNILFTKKFILL